MISEEFCLSDLSISNVVWNVNMPLKLSSRKEKDVMERGIERMHIGYLLQRTTMPV